MDKKVYLESNKQTVQKDEEIEITVKIKGFETVAYNLYIYFNKDKFEFISGPENTNQVENYLVSIWHDVNGGINPKADELGKFIFKAKESGCTEFNISGNFYNVDLEETDTIFEKVKIKVDTGKENESDASDELNSNLEMLAIENVIITPLFDNAITSYEAQIGKEKEKLNILAIPENENASVKIYGNENLKEGNNIIRIVVDSLNNSIQKEYKINVYKRNEVEELNYRNEEKINKQKLENFYETEKMSYIEETIEKIEKDILPEATLENEEKQNLFLFVAFIMIIVTIGIIVMKKLKDR